MAMETRMRGESTTLSAMAMGMGAKQGGARGGCRSLAALAVEWERDEANALRREWERTTGEWLAFIDEEASFLKR